MRGLALSGTSRRWRVTSLLATITLLIGAAMVPVLVPQGAQPALAVTSGDTVDLRVLLVGAPGGGTSDPNTAAWAAGLSSQGVAYTEVDATGTLGSATVSLPALTSSVTHGLFNGVVLAGKPADFAAGQLSALFSYESTFGIRQIDGDFVPNGTTGLSSVTDADSGATVSGTTASLTAAGVSTFGSLNGPVPIDTGSFASPGTVATGLPTGATETPLLNDAAGNVLVGVYQHPTAAQAPTDPQAGVAELTVGMAYNANQTQWLLLGAGLIDWVTADAHLGDYRHYVEMDIDDTFTPDDAWNTTLHTIDYSDADALRMRAADVDYAAQWSAANNFRMDQLFNGGGSVAYQADNGTDPVLAEFQKTDPATGKPYADDFGWLSHTYDTPYMDVGCATQNYIEAELNENTSWAAAAPGNGTGGLGLTESTDTGLALGTENPSVFVPGNHSGFADLVPGNPATVDPPILDDETPGTGGTLTAGNYEYAVTDQFNAADSPSVDQSSAFVTPSVTVAASGEVTLDWQAICHAANYLIYREVVGSNDWFLIGSVATPASATLPDNSSGEPASTTDVTNGGELEQTFVDTGLAGTAQAAGWTPPTTENANEQPWEQNPYFIPALEAVGITAVGDDASKAYPNPPTDEFGIGAAYTGASYPVGATFVDGTAQVVPRHPINIFYNNSTETQAVDEYNTFYLAKGVDQGQCTNTSTTTCLSTPATFADIVNQVVSGMYANMLNNDPRPSYVHQTNIIGQPPAGPATAGTPPATVDTTGDGLLYSVLNPLLAEYHADFNATAPYEQLTLGAIATVLADQTAWATTQPAGTATTSNTVTASETGGNITITNTGTSSVAVPITAPLGYEYNGALFGSQYGGSLSAWQTLTAGQSIVIAAVPPTITSAATANAQVGSPFTFTVTTTGSPAPVVTETGTLPAGLTFAQATVDGVASITGITGTPAAGTGGTYPITFTATNPGGVATQAFSLFVAQPSLSITPTTSPPSYAVAGTPITYSYNVTNTGNVALVSVGVTDTLAGLSAVTCPGTTLAVLEAETCNAHYVVTQADVDGGGITDAALVSGTPPSTTVVTASASVHTPAIQAPAIAVRPTAVPGHFYAAGTPETFNDVVTNSGDVTLHGIGVTDPHAGLSAVTCPSPTLAPAGTETCTANYTTTAADVHAHGVRDTPAATGTPPSGPTVHGSSTAVFPLWVAPAITSAELTTVPRKTNVKFDFTASGKPSPMLTLTGALPKGVTFRKGLGIAKLIGTVNAAGTYPLTLTATSAAGTSEQSVSLHVTAPELTSRVSAQPGNAKATVGWVAPALHGGLPVTGYVVTPYIGHTALTALTFHSVVTHDTITGLSNGRQYTFKVAAMNKLGTGPNSFTTPQIHALGVGPASPASPAIRIGTPTAPQNVTATPTTINPGSLLVRFAGASGNGSPISSYTATCVSSDGGQTSTAVDTSGDARSIVVSGVTLNKTYTCSVTAANTRGDGPAATSSSVVA
ncbi:MAG: fibronectin type III domain-containing protein [Acidimicrobiia bacterium]